MSEDRSSSRATWATVIATAAVTVAVGVTAAALGGYITPARDPAAQLSSSPDQPASPTTGAPQSAPSGGANVVLVPIAPDVPAANPVAAEPAFELLSYEAREPEVHRGRSHGPHEDHEDEGKDEGDDEGKDEGDDEGEHDDD